MAWYTVFTGGLAGELQAPLPALVTEATRAKIVEPHCIPSTATDSPPEPLETSPERVVGEPYTDSGGAAAIETPVRTTTVPRFFVLNASRKPKLPDFRNVYEYVWFGASTGEAVNSPRSETT